MIKNIAVKTGFFVSVLFFLSASKPSLDGRAIVAAAGELPSGLYVKAAAFLPGDTVLITNPAAKVSIEALVFGTFSPSDGVAVVLSPEAARLLFIDKDLNSIVQITKNGNDTERSVLTKVFENASSEPASSVPGGENAGRLNDDSVLYEDYMKSEAQHNSSPEVAAATENTPAADDNTAENSEHTVNETSGVQAEDAVAKNTSETEKTAVEPDVSADDKTAEVFTPFADAEEKTSDTVDTVYEEPLVEVAEVVPETPPEDTAPASEDGFADASVPGDTVPAEDNPPVSEAEEIAATEYPSDVQDPILTEEQNIFEKESIPNVLVAAEDNPPRSEEEKDGTEDAVPDSEKLPDFFTYGTTDGDEQTRYDDRLYDDYSGSAYAASADMERYLINSVSDFGEGNYCIQLATYKNRANITGVIERYAYKYPLRLIKSEKIPDAYQVFIGPLKKDEYPVLLKRFVSWGFKDAFLREIR